MRGLIIGVALVTLSGCAGPIAERAQKSPHEEHSPSDAGVSLTRLIGIWAQGQERLQIGSESTYHWERETRCPLAPCPIAQSSGSFTLSEGRLVLATVAGPSLTLSYTLASDPRRITIRHPDGRQWTLPFVE